MVILSWAMDAWHKHNKRVIRHWVRIKLGSFILYNGKNNAAGVTVTKEARYQHLRNTPLPNNIVYQRFLPPNTYPKWMPV